MNKRIVPLRDENNNIIKCGYRGCDKAATVYDMPIWKEKPLCPEHDYIVNYAYPDKMVEYITNKDGSDGHIVIWP